MKSKIKKLDLDNLWYLNCKSSNQDSSDEKGGGTNVGIDLHYSNLITKIQGVSTKFPVPCLATKLDQNLTMYLMAGHIH